MSNDASASARVTPVVAYFVGLAAMVPFISLTVYTGPAARALGGADVSFAVGLAVAAGLYFLFSRGLDLSAEREAVTRSREALLAEAGS